MNETLTIRLDQAIAKALAEEAKRTSRSKGHVVRQALVEHLRRSRPSALDALGKYIGIISGPADLSTNKKHLADLGRRRRK